MGCRAMKNLFCLPLVAVAAACAGSGHTVPDFAQAPAPTGYDFFTPPPEVSAAQSPSLWETAPSALLSMRRAKEVGDLLTVIVEMDDRASLESSLSRRQGTEEDFNVDALFGLPQIAGNFLPAGSSLTPGVDLSRNSRLDGSGRVNRAEQVTFTLAARVIGVEPNGNLVIRGYQQTRVSNETRYLSVSGVIRAQDITRTNTVAYDKIADANLSYVSSGEVSTATRSKVGTGILGRILPF